MPSPWQINVSGNLASGKSTVASLIASAFGWQTIPKQRPELGYIKDIFQKPERWSFEGQIAFLASKAEQISHAHSIRQGFVVDRSAYEDVYVFGQQFYEAGQMDRRAFNTYSTISAVVLDRLPPPDLLIFCQCSLKTCQERILKRNRENDKLLPSDFLEGLAARLQEWLPSYEHSAVYIVDTEHWDLTKDSVRKTFIEELRSVMAQATSIPGQISLFDNQTPTTKRTTLLKSYRPFKSKKAASIPTTTRIQSFKALERPQVYLAAPFTGIAAQPQVQARPDQLFTIIPPHGIIPPSPYRRALTLLAKKLEQLGFNVLLPHRDINKWGKKTLTAQEVVENCSTQVRQSALFVGILAQSNGSHFEFGIAAALGIPSIILQVKDLPTSFFGSGASSLEQCLVIECGSMRDAIKALNSPQVLDFIQNHGIV